MSDAENKIKKLREMQRVKSQASKAVAVIDELELKIIEREEDIQRMRDHIEVQKKIKADSEIEYAKMAQEQGK